MRRMMAAAVVFGVAGPARGGTLGPYGSARVNGIDDIANDDESNDVVASGQPTTAVG